MLLDSTHRRWAFLTIVLLGFAVGAYIPYSRHELNGPTGGSIPGLVYGVAGSLCILFAALFGLRKKLRAWRIGRAETWLRAHLWLGLLAGPLILLHAGFHMGGPVTLVAMVLLGVVIASGVFGLVLQNWIPRTMMVRVPFETIHVQIDVVSEQLLREADLLVAEVCPSLPPLDPPTPAALPTKWGPRDLDCLKLPKVKYPVEAAVKAKSAPIQDFYLSEVRRFLGDGRSGLLASTAKTRAAFEQVKTLVPPPLAQALEDLEEMCEERRQLELQRRLHHLLHFWLLVHGPLAYALVILGAAHAVTALRF
ncbi:MAG TPA: hypothetical protein VFF73_15020 [Planctomycetota bacterium]|nr:hypothetical protein [Planctomycetota bacterium]